MLALAAGASAGIGPRASAQRAALPMVGFLNGGDPATFARLIAAFREGLREAGLVDGRDVVVELRFAHGDGARLPALARELLALQPTVMVVTGGGSVLGVRAVRSVDNTIPLVFVSGTDPVQAGLVDGLARPGTNTTGVTTFTTVLAAKRLALLKEAVPGATRIAILLNPSNPPLATPQRAEAEAAAAQLGVQLIVAEAAAAAEFGPAFQSMIRSGAQALQVAADPFFFGRRAELVAQAAHHRLPAIYEWPDFVELGGLMSYGTFLAEAYRQIGVYAGRIIRGASPSTLPVLQATRFQLVVNLRVAKALGLVLPPTLIAAADEVIE